MMVEVSRVRALVLSASTAASTKFLVESWQKLLEQTDNEEELNELVGRQLLQRDAMEFGVALAYRSVNDLRAKLENAAQAICKRTDHLKRIDRFIIDLGSDPAEIVHDFKVYAMRTPRITSLFRACLKRVTSYEGLIAQAALEEPEFDGVDFLEAVAWIACYCVLARRTLPTLRIVFSGQGLGRIAALLIYLAGQSAKIKNVNTGVNHQLSIKRGICGYVHSGDGFNNGLGVNAVGLAEIFGSLAQSGPVVDELIMEGRKLASGSPIFREQHLEWLCQGIHRSTWEDSTFEPRLQALAYLLGFIRLSRRWNISVLNVRPDPRYAVAAQAISEFGLSCTLVRALVDATPNSLSELTRQLFVSNAAFKRDSALDRAWIDLERVDLDSKLLQSQILVAARQPITLNVRPCFKMWRAGATSCEESLLVRLPMGDDLTHILLECWQSGQEVSWGTVLGVFDEAKFSRHKIPQLPFNLRFVEPQETEAPVSALGEPLMGNFELELKPSVCKTDEAARLPRPEIAEKLRLIPTEEFSTALHLNPNAGYGSLVGGAETLSVTSFLRDGVLVVRMASPTTRNRFDAHFIEKLVYEVERASEDLTVKVVVLTASGEYFSAGGTAHLLNRIQRGDQTFETLTPLYQAFRLCPVPVIASITGHAYGGGLMLGLHCDYQIFSRESKYAANFIQHGITPGMGASFLVPMRLGSPLGLEMLLTGREVSGQELFTRAPHLKIVAAVDVEKTALELAHSIAQQPRHTLKLLAQLLRGATQVQVDECLANEMSAQRLNAGLREAKPPAVPPFSGPNQTKNHLPEVSLDVGKEQFERTVYNKLAGVAKELLMLDATPAADQNLLEMGMDSVSVVSFIAELNALTGGAVDVSVFYEGPSLRRLAAIAVNYDRSVRTVVVAPRFPDRTGTNPDTQVIGYKPSVHVPRELQEFVQENLMLENLPGVDLRLDEVGADSVFVVGLIETINDRAKSRLDVSAFYESPTLLSLWAKAMPMPVPSAPIDSLRASLTADLSTSNELSRSANAVVATDNDAIAVIGMSGRFPGAESIDDYFENLTLGRSGVTTIPSSRWNSAALYSSIAGKPGTSATQHGGFLSDIDTFDADLFQVSPREAAAMDPQHRLFLTEAFKALEDAGYAMLGKVPNTGVYLGIRPGDYFDSVARSNADAATFLGGDQAIGVGRLSYLMDFRGPCLAVDTACSSSLVAVDSACRALRTKQIDMAVAGGVSAFSGPRLFIEASSAGMLSPQGRCAAFDRRADGFVPAEGVGVLILKRIDDAVRDCDRIYGLIRGTAVNHDGAKGGITVPKASAQSDVVLAALADAKLTPADISYVEAHGTGTRLGDPIELSGLAKVFGQNESPCFVGSVKSNIGHSICAAGVAGLIKSVLMVSKKKFLPSIHYLQENPNFSLKGTALKICTEELPWETAAGQRRFVGVSSFGFSGTNAHVVIGDSSQVATRPGPPIEWSVFAISARDSAGIRQRALDIAQWMSTVSEENLYALAFTLCCRRAHRKFRYSFVAQSWGHARQSLENFGRSQTPTEQAGDNRLDLPERRIADHTNKTGDRRVWAERMCATFQADSAIVAWEEFFPVAVCPLALPPERLRKTRFWHTSRSEPALNEDTGSKIELSRVSKDPQPTYFEYQWIARKRLIEESAGSKTQSIVIDFPLGTQFLNRQFGQQSLFKIIARETIERHTREAAAQSALAPVTIFDLSLCMNRVARPSGVDLAADTSKVLKNFLNLLQVMALLSPIDILLVVVTKHAVSALAEHSAIDCAGAATIGMLSAAAAELPNVRIRCVDIEDDAQLPEVLLRESKSLQEKFEVVCYRGASRQVRCLVPSLMQSHLREQSSFLHDGSRVLFVGGLGGIGREICLKLATKYRCSLILFGRSPLSEPDNQFLDRLRALGARAQYLQCDISDSGKVREVVASLVSGNQRIDLLVNGAIHLGDQSIARMSEECLEECLAPKVRGTINLVESFGAILPKKIILLSSIASFIGSPGQVNYAAASAFIDGYSQMLNHLGGDVTSINWGIWKDVGIVANASHLAAQSRNGVFPISTEKGVDSFFTAIDSNSRSLIFASLDQRHWQSPSACRSPAVPRLSELARDLDAGINPCSEIEPLSHLMLMQTYKGMSTALANVELSLNLKMGKFLSGLKSHGQ
jgi:3-oxoacyl-(acyl-carrier-protein) synthase/enoyl-CoA hydratase/carnithine racemase/NAD(P)-dependent dehydrogenase (short-subunit alcohol dehydrogenase family)/aryl carrier-like protein